MVGNIRAASSVGVVVNIVAIGPVRDMGVVGNIRVVESIRAV